MAATTDSISVWIVEDKKLFRTEFKAMIDETSDIVCMAEFASVEKMIKHTESGGDLKVPDVVMMDVRLPGKSGIDGVEYLKDVLPEVNTVMLTMHKDADIIYNALRAGAIGYMIKGARVDQTLTAIRQAAQGVMMMPEEVAKKMRSFFEQLPEKTEHSLTSREMDVLECMCEGLKQKEIAETLFISPNTVGQHIRSVYTKLQVKTRAGAVAKALRNNIIR